MPESRIGTLHSAHPDPSGHLQLLGCVRSEIRAVLANVVRHLNCRIEVARPPFGLVANPLAVVTYIFSEGFESLPLSVDEVPRGARSRVHGWSPRELRRDLDHRLVDENRNRVEVAGIGFEAEPLRFHRDGSRTCERIMNRGQSVSVEHAFRLRVLAVQLARLSPGFRDFGAGFVQDLVVVCVLPLDELIDDSEESFAAGDPARLEVLEESRQDAPVPTSKMGR